MKKAQLKELVTQYGPIEFFWMDHAVGDGGLNHKETVEWVHQFQPNCFVGFNHGEPAGRLSLREMGNPGLLAMPVQQNTIKKQRPITKDISQLSLHILFYLLIRVVRCGFIPYPNTIPLSSGRKTLRRLSRCC